MPSLTVACVLRSGPLYTESWVDRLRRAVKENLTAPHRFVCLTDMAPDCETIPLINTWPRWWPKIELFRPKLFTGRVLYLDLDMIITGSLDRIAEHPHHFTMCHDFYRPHWKCSTVMAWDGLFDFKIYQQFARNPHSYAQNYRGGVGRKLGDQGFIEDYLTQRKVHIDTFKDLFGVNAIASYKVHRCFDGPPPDAAAVAFHGKPKPCDIKAGWVRDAWQQ